MRSSIFPQIVPVDWRFPEEMAALCLAFAIQADQADNLERWMQALTPEVASSRRRAALEAVRMFFEAGLGMALVAWVLEVRAPRWSRRRRRHVLQVLTDWAVACGAPREQLQILFKLEQLDSLRGREIGRYGDRPPR
ncbi:MAG: hypothetical protein Q9M35_02740 [Rhodothermus sp.]|nr:hypothetical protein [Rhodothermus sp.]